MFDACFVRSTKCSTLASWKWKICWRGFPPPCTLKDLFSARQSEPDIRTKPGPRWVPRYGIRSRGRSRWWGEPPGAGRWTRWGGFRIRVGREERSAVWSPSRLQRFLLVGWCPLVIWKTIFEIFKKANLNNPYTDQENIEAKTFSKLESLFVSFVGLVSA